MEDCRKAMGIKLSPQTFKKKLQDYCKLKGYILNPKELQRADGRILQRIIINSPYGQKESSRECIYLQVPRTEEKAETQQPLTDITNEIHSLIDNLENEIDF